MCGGVGIISRLYRAASILFGILWLGFAQLALTVANVGYGAPGAL